MKRSSVKACLVALAALLTALLSSCDDPRKDTRSFGDFVKYFTAKLKVESSKALVADTIHAEYGAAFKIKGREVAVYKFNPVKKKAMDKVERITNDGFVYIVGVKYPAIRNGSFILIDYQSHPDKDEIIRVFKDF